MKEQEIKGIIKCIHEMYYNENLFEDKMLVYKFHQHMSELFNWAGITDTLCENHPDEARPSDLLKMGFFDR